MSMQKDVWNMKNACACQAWCYLCLATTFGIIVIAIITPEPAKRFDRSSQAVFGISKTCGTNDFSLRCRLQSIFAGTEWSWSHGYVIDLSLPKDRYINIARKQGSAGDAQASNPVGNVAPRKTFSSPSTPAGSSKTIKTNLFSGRELIIGDQIMNLLPPPQPPTRNQRRCAPIWPQQPNSAPRRLARCTE